MRRLKLVIETNVSTSDLLVAIGQLSPHYIEMSEDDAPIATGFRDALQDAVVGKPTPPGTRDYKAEHAKRKARERERDKLRKREKRAKEKAKPQTVEAKFEKIEEIRSGAHGKEALIYAPLGFREYNPRIDITATLKALGRTREEVKNAIWPIGTAENRLKTAMNRNEMFAKQK